MFSGVYWNQPVCLSICVSIHMSVCLQNTSFGQSPGWSIKSHLVIAVVFSNMVDLIAFKILSQTKFTCG